MGTAWVYMPSVVADPEPIGRVREFSQEYHERSMTSGP
jgi:hypothetical protein